MNRSRPGGPYVVAGLGGSGTRVITAILQQSGMWIGTNLNGPLDALDFADYCGRWIPTFRQGADRPVSTAVLAQMRRQLNEVVEDHLASIDAASTAWGWKNSGSLHLLPFLHSQLPSLQVVHVVRDGRDMAYSPNQYQVRRYGPVLLTRDERRRSQPLRSIALWSRLNLEAADYASKHLEGRYLLVRYEDLCVTPLPVIHRILDFCGLNADATRLAHDCVRKPRSMGRWRNHHPSAVARLCKLAGTALRRFGYSDGAEMEPLGRTLRVRVLAFEQALRSRLSAGLGGHVAEHYRLLRRIPRRWRPQPP